MFNSVVKTSRAMFLAWFLGCVFRNEVLNKSPGQKFRSEKHGCVGPACNLTANYGREMLSHHSDLLHEDKPGCDLM